MIFVFIKFVKSCFFCIFAHVFVKGNRMCWLLKSNIGSKDEKSCCNIIADVHAD